MPVTPTGPISLPLSHLRTLVASCDAFQTWVGAADLAEALARVHLCELPAPGDHGGYTPAELAALRPCAIVDLWTPARGYGEEPFARTRVALEGAFVDGGKLTLDLIQDVAEADASSLVDAKFRFLNAVGGILDDMAGLAGTEGYLSIPLIELYQGPKRSDGQMREEQGDFWRVQFVVHWGI